jgi:hypothetical protein
MPYEMNDQEHSMFNWECSKDYTFSKRFLGVKYKWWVEGQDVVFDYTFIPNFKKLWKDHLSEQLWQTLKD